MLLFVRYGLYKFLTWTHEIKRLLILYNSTRINIVRIIVMY